MTSKKNPIHDDYKVKHLFLIVGGNPLPNVVAGRLLLAENGTVYLVHSKSDSRNGIRGTGEVANRIGQMLVGVATVQIEVSESDAKDIKNEVGKALKKISSESVGLNYTGGTKAMAIHTYQAILEWAEHKINPVFSYLDPRSMRMRFDDGYSEYVATASDASLTLEDLMYLHGEMLFNERLQPRRRPFLPDTAKHLAEMIIQYNKPNEYWREWYKKHIRPHKLNKAKKVGNRYQNWDDEEVLQNLTIPWPKPDDLGQTMRQELVSLGYPEKLPLLSFKEIKKVLPFERLEEFCAWFSGQWLEHHLLACLMQVDKEYDLGFSEQVINIKPFNADNIEKGRDPLFEVDVVSIRGYQLFGFSCSMKPTVDVLKLKLFEALVRSRQLGGDEARIALVCGFQNPKQLQEQIRRTIDQHVTVFGKMQLRNLNKYLAQWIEQEKGKEDN